MKFKWNENKTGVNTIDKSMFIPKGHRLWSEYNIDLAVENKEILSFQTEEEKIVILINTARQKRVKELGAYDKLIANVSFGTEILTSDEKKEIIDWRQQWLDLPSKLDVNQELDKQIPKTPKKVEYYKSV